MDPQKAWRTPCRAQNCPWLDAHCNSMVFMSQTCSPSCIPSCHHNVKQPIGHGPVYDATWLERQLCPPFMHSYGASKAAIFQAISCGVYCALPEAMWASQGHLLSGLKLDDNRLDIAPCVSFPTWMYTLPFFQRGGRAFFPSASL